MRGIYMIRQLVKNRPLLNSGSIRCSSSLPYETPISSVSVVNVSSLSSSKSFFSNNCSTQTTSKLQSLIPSLQFQRTLCSSPDNSNVVLIKSEEQLNTSMKKVQDKSLPAIFYFTAVWCGPCKLISPILTNESAKYPDVTTYKIDIDQQGLGSILNQLHISSVPTLYFFQNGKKAAEIVGADFQRVKDIMEDLYGC